MRATATSARAAWVHQHHRHQIVRPMATCRSPPVISVPLARMAAPDRRQALPTRRQCHKSTVPLAAAQPGPSVGRSAGEAVTVDFTDTAAAFSARSTAELLRAYMVFQLCRSCVHTTRPLLHRHLGLLAAKRSAERIGACEQEVAGEQRGDAAGAVSPSVRRRAGGDGGAADLLRAFLRRCVAIPRMKHEGGSWGGGGSHHCRAGTPKHGEAHWRQHWHRRSSSRAHGAGRQRQLGT